MARTALLVVDGLGLSGKTRTMAFLAAHLNRQRFRAEVCTLTPETSVLQDQLEQAGVPIHVIPCRAGLDTRAILRLGALIRTSRCDVVHCYNPRPILYGGIAASLCGVNARVGSLSAFACQVPDRDYGFLPQPLSTRSRKNVLRNRLAARTMRYLTAVSPSLGARFCEYNRIPLAKMRVVPYGADLEAVDRVSAEETRRLRDELGLEADDIVVGSVGRLVEQKDYPTQLQAFALAVARVPTLRMVLAGAGPLEESLRQLSASLGIDRFVRFIGHWTRVPTLLRSLDIFVLSSKFEPFGVALLEAKAAGVAIVATSVNEIPEIVTDRRTGLLTPVGDADAMAQRLVELASDAGLRGRLGTAARHDARATHSLNAVVDAYEVLYESCF